MVTRTTRAPARRRVAPPTAGTSIAQLEPGTLVLTCERVRKALLGELRQPDEWQGRIYVVISPALTDNSPAMIGAQYFRQGWQYRIELPIRIEPAKLVRSLTQVLLLEFANRSRPERSAELPLWLTEGFTQHLLHSTLVDLVVRPPIGDTRPVPVRETQWQQVGLDPLESVRERLNTHAAMSFTRMSDLVPQDLAEETWLTFQACSHLFVARLLEMPNGREGLAHMLAILPRHLNWQTALFKTFDPVFQRMLDVEKWWSVVLFQFTGVDALNAWSLEVALDKLDEMLAVPVLVGTAQRSLPSRRRVTVQEIVQNWDFLSQQSLLQGVANELATARVRMPPELIPLLTGYQRELQDYLLRRASAGQGRSLPGLPSTTADLLVREALRELDALDRQRDALRPSPSPRPNSTAPSAPPPDRPAP